MKGIHILAIAMTLALSATQISAYVFEVENLLNVPIKVEIPLVAELKNPEVITIPAKGRGNYSPQGWYAGYCLNIQSIKVAKEGTGFVVTPLKWVTSGEEDLRRMLRESATGNGKVNIGSVENFRGTFAGQMNCNPTFFYIMEDTNGNLFAILGEAKR